MVLLALTACGGGSDDEPPVTVTTQNATEAPTEAPTVAQTASTPAATTTATARATATPEPVGPPNRGAWIDVDVTRLTVSLMNGVSVVREIAPVAVGAQIDTGVYESTQTGLFYVNSKDESLTYDAPYDTYISHWVGFDAARANGFHSFLKDKEGAVVDASTGRVSNGCIRTGNPEAIYAFAQVGMPVYVHY